MSGLRSVAPVAVGSVSGALEPLLTRHARGHVGNGTAPRRRDRCPALRADAVFAIGDAAKRDLQALRPLTEAGRAEARQLLLFEALGEVEEVATRQTGARHPGLGLQSLADRGELGLQQELRTTVRVVHALQTTATALWFPGPTLVGWANRAQPLPPRRRLKCEGLMCDRRAARLMEQKVMERKLIRGVGVESSRIGLGTWSIGGWMWGGSDDAEAVKTIRTALDLGITLIDTAPAYGFGRSEELVGQAIAEQGGRERVLIATKTGLGWHAGAVY